MTVVNGYISREALKGELNISDVEQENDAIDRAINSASRWIDRHCRRFFYDAESVSARTYIASDPYFLDVDDFSTTTGLVVATDEENNGVYDTVWDAADFQAEPLVRNEGWPFESIQQIGYARSFPLYGPRARVQVTARWGWAAVPSEVEQACELKAKSLLARRRSPEGVFATEGAILRVGGFDRDVAELLAPFRKVAVTVA